MDARPRKSALGYGLPVDSPWLYSYTAAAPEAHMRLEEARALTFLLTAVAHMAPTRKPRLWEIRF